MTSISSASSRQDRVIERFTSSLEETLGGREVLARLVSLRSSARRTRGECRLRGKIYCGPPPTSKAGGKRVGAGRLKGLPNRKSRSKKAYCHLRRCWKRKVNSRTLARRKRAIDRIRNEKCQARQWELKNAQRQITILKLVEALRYGDFSNVLLDKDLPTLTPYQVLLLTRKCEAIMRYLSILVGSPPNTSAYEAAERAAEMMTVRQYHKPVSAKSILTWHKQYQ